VIAEVNLGQLRQDLSQGRVGSWIFTDPGVHRLELERLFTRTWCYLAHESEIPQPGDYVTRRLGSDGVIVVRGADGVVRCLLNTCRHRGMRVCRVDRGQAAHFTCPYHGWTYANSGQLLGVVAEREAYGEGLDKAEYGLRQARVDSYAGLIFGNWWAEAPPLAEYLGDMRWYLDLVFKRTVEGMKVVGPPQRWVVDANWKIPAENFVGDGYHLSTTHRFAFAARLASARDASTEASPHWTHYHIDAGNGHGLQIAGFEPPAVVARYMGLPEELWPQVRDNLTLEQAGVLEHATTIHGTVFPNLSVLNTVAPPRPSGEPAVGWATLRVWQPLAPDKLELWSWFLVEKTSPDWYQQASYETYVLVFGSAGTFEQDDTEIWAGITAANMGVVGRESRLAYLQGLDATPDPNWPGPGQAYSLGYCELNQRAFLGRWLELLEG